MKLTRSPALVLLAALAMTGLTARLGFWQLDRAAQKQERQAAIEQRQNLMPLTNAALPSTPDQAEPEFGRRAELTGRWMPQYTIFLENRQMHGRPGFVAVTPLDLGDGTAVLVQRGWLPRDPSDRTRVAEPPTPSTEQLLFGRMSPSPGRLYEFEATSQGRIRQNINIDDYSTETGLRLRPLSILMLQPSVSGREPVEDGLLRDWPQPAVDVHKHYGYAFQWFALAALTFGLYVWFQILRPWRKRRSLRASL